MTHPLRFCFVLLAALISFSSVVSADVFYVPGSWSTGPSWDPSSNPTTDLGGGLSQLTLTGQTPNTRYEFKVLATSGDWNTHINQPDGSNMWGYSDSNGNITITVDGNSLGNGFLRDTNRILVSGDPTSWNAVGNFMDETGGASDWNNGDPLFALTDAGGGFFTYTTSGIATPGTYNGRIVNSGTWDGFGTHGRSVDSWNWELVTALPGDRLQFTLDTSNGASFATVISIPEPSSLAVLGLVGIGLVARRKRR